MSDEIVDRVEALIDRITAFAGVARAPELARLRARLREPLRIAIAGRVKAGKSTLLNALVGEKLAPTDAGECTRVVAWYQDGISYGVEAILTDGSRRDAAFRRDGGALDIDLPVELSAVERLEISWPSASLRDATLIDTPGLESVNTGTSLRTRDFLGVDDDRPSDADAVIYLMRHLHRRDAEFLDAFLDHSLSNASPVNAVAVLSRADEMGAGRPDAMVSARRIAARYASDPRIKELCSDVVPIAGLIAETGLTLTENEAALLRRLASLSDGELGSLLLSADRFVSPSLSDLTPETRAELLDRLGLFGLRRCIGWIRDGSASTAVELARQLVAESGLDELRALVREHFLPRAHALKTRSVLVSLRSLARSLATSDAGLAARIEAETEAVEAATHELAELRLAHLVQTGMVSLSEADAAEVTCVTRPGALFARLRLDEGASVGAIQTAALEGVQRWRSRAEIPTLDPSGREASEIVARSYEGIYAAAHAMAPSS